VHPGGRGGAAPLMPTLGVKRRMIKKIILFIYIAFLLLFAASSIISVWLSDPLIILAIEVITDLIIVSGVILFVKKVRYKPWAFMLALSIIFQIFIFIQYPSQEISEFFLWTVILAPAVLMNIQVTGLFNSQMGLGKATLP